MIRRLGSHLVERKRVLGWMRNRANDRPPVLSGFSRRAWFPEHAEMVRLVYGALYKVWGTAVDLGTDLLRLLWLNSGRVHADSVLLDSH